MKENMIVILSLFISSSLLAVWQVGDIITEDYSWTDSNNETHSIHELIDSGKSVVLFWGGTG